jgi:hypothetical protein
MSDVALVHSLDHGRGHDRRGAQVAAAVVPGTELLVSAHARRPRRQDVESAVGSVGLDVPAGDLELVEGNSGRVVGGPQVPGSPVDEDQRGQPVRVCRPEDDALGSRQERCQHGGPVAPDGIHHGDDVACPLLARRRCGRGPPVGEPRSTCVEPDEPGERRKSPWEPGHQWVVVHAVDRDPLPRAEEQVYRAVAEDLERDVGSIGRCLPGLGSGRHGTRVVPGRNSGSYRAATARPAAASGPPSRTASAARRWRTASAWP